MMGGENGKPFLTNTQIVFLASMIAADFGSGLVIKNLLAPTHILDLIRIDMIVPIVLMLVTRRLLDRFGVLILYETVWGICSVFAMPAAFGLPGLLKLLPAVTQGIILDTLMSLFRRFHRLRFYISALLGGTLSFFAYFGIRLALGYPWNEVIRALFSVQLLTTALVWVAGAALALLVWKQIGSTPLARRLAVAEPA
ncbi:hypothetical protein GF324_11740 [bacterium]|nr:hypothetical protein [bacterium]